MVIYVVDLIIYIHVQNDYSALKESKFYGQDQSFVEHIHCDE